MSSLSTGALLDGTGRDDWEEKKIYNHHDNHNISIQAVATRVLKGEYQLLAHIQAPLEQY
jgi:hypothetical protein